MDAAEHDVFDAGLLCRAAGELEGVADKDREVNDGVLLVVVAEYGELAAEGVPGVLDAQTQLWIRELVVDGGEGLLPDFGHVGGLLWGDSIPREAGRQQVWPVRGAGSAARVGARRIPGVCRSVRDCTRAAQGGAL